MKYTVSRDAAGPLTVTALDNGLVMIADRNHPNFSRIVEATEGYDNTFNVPENEKRRFRDLFDVSESVREFFQPTPRVTLENGELRFDGRVIEGVLAEHVIRGIRQGLPQSAFMPFIKFWENVQSNPDDHSRENLLRWLMAEEFTITDEGMIVGYKGVRDDLTSLTAGPGVVDGVQMNGNLPNKPGSVVEVERSYVTWNPAVSCAEGLHVGTWKYAHDFGPKTLEVWVHPADVVSVPTDCNGQKMRVSKYTVKRLLNEGYSLAVLDTSEVDYDQAHHCPECGEEIDPEQTMCEDCEPCDRCGYHPEDCECDEW